MNRRKFLGAAGAGAAALLSGCGRKPVWETNTTIEGYTITLPKNQDISPTEELKNNPNSQRSLEILANAKADVRNAYQQVLFLIDTNILGPEDVRFRDLDLDTDDRIQGYYFEYTKNRGRLSRVTRTYGSTVMHKYFAEMIVFDHSNIINPDISHILIGRPTDTLQMRYWTDQLRSGKNLLSGIHIIDEMPANIAEGLDKITTVSPSTLPSV